MLPWKLLGTQDNTCCIVEIHRLAFLNLEAGLVPCESFRTRHESLNPIIAPTNRIIVNLVVVRCIQWTQRPTTRQDSASELRRPGLQAVSGEPHTLQLQI